jgi:hypothetical protein
MADKVEVINVTEYAGATDRRGNDCWKLKAIVPWSDFAIEYLEWPRLNGQGTFQLGQYRVELNRGNSFRNKQGSDRDYDYYWNPISMDYLGAPAKKDDDEKDDEQEGNNGNQQSNYRRSSGLSEADVIKNRSVAISYAKDAWCAGKIERDELSELAASFHDMMLHGFTEEATE